MKSEKSRRLLLVKRKGDYMPRMIGNQMGDFLESDRLSIDTRFKDVLFALNQSAIVAITDRTGAITFVNNKFTEISGYETEELIGQKHSIINSKYHSKDFFKNMWKTIGEGSVWRGEIRNQKKGGTYYWVDTTIVPFLNDKGIPYQYISIRYDITDRKKAEEVIRHLAYNDQLTGLPNRIYFREKLSESLVVAKKNNGKIGLVKLNVDRFHYINDSLSYEIGDYVLSVVARRLKKVLPPKNIAARLSGDEFAVILAQQEDVENAEAVVMTIQEAIQKPIEINGQQYIVTTSAGIAYYPVHASETSELSTKAEKALLEAKEQGGSGYQIYEPGTVQKSLERIFLENELRKSIRYGYFHLDYQPKFDIATKKITGVEALVRWDHPDLGRISPNKFIEIAEETRMINDLGEWVLKEACKQAKEWEEKGYYYSMAVNVSAIQLENPAFFNQLKKIIDEIGNRPDLLELELTESSFGNRAEMQEMITRIRALGIKIAIDDFGTGYSSFSYIQELPVDTLKIDRAFIQAIGNEKERNVIIEAILSVAKAVGLNVVAEGIEEKEQLRILREMGCQQGQGYYFSRPTDAAACEGFMAANGPR